jgi:iron complex outermembrane recepter protein
VTANYSHQDVRAVVGQYPYDPATEIATAAPVAGNWLPSAPANSGNLWVKYTADGDFKGLSVGGCLNIIGSQFWDNANSFKLPQYTLVNGMISCCFPWQGAKITAQLNIKNLFDTAFYQSAGNRYYIISGAPRAILSSLRLEF